MAFLSYLWYGHKALLDKAFPFLYSPLIYYQDGVSLYLHGHWNAEGHCLAARAICDCLVTNRLSKTVAQEIAG